MAAPEPTTYPDLKPKWRERFTFFDTYSRPGSADYQAAIKAAPFRQRILITSNLIAVFFGPIYFFVLGLWKKCLTLLAVGFGIGLVIVTLEMKLGWTVSASLDTGISCGLGVLYMLTANHAYYLHKVKGVQGWNPFEGWAKRKDALAGRSSRVGTDRPQM